MTSLVEITIPTSVTRLRENLFKGCTALKTVVLHDGVTDIDSGTFMDCTSLTELNLPLGLTKLGDHVFKGCSALTAVVLPDGITTMNGRVCPALTQPTTRIAPIN